MPLESLSPAWFVLAAGRCCRAGRLRHQSGHRHAGPGVPERGRRDQEVQGSAPDAAAAVRRRVRRPADRRQYVNEVGQRAAKASQRPELQYTFTVLDSEEINAFTTGGGYVYITRGIMNYLNTEAELEAVLGHEIGHVTRAPSGAPAEQVDARRHRRRGGRHLHRQRAISQGSRTTPAPRSSAATAATRSSRPTGSARSTWSRPATRPST